MNLLTALVAPFIALGTMIGGLFIDEAQLGATEAIPVTIAFFETTLQDAITSSATSFTLTSATDKDGTTLASSTYAFVIDEGSANEEIVIADCTSTACTNALRGVSARTGNTEVAALKKAHRRGASVKITDAPILMLVSRILRGEQGVDFTPDANSDLVTKTYVDSLALGTTTVAATTADDGLVELATGTEAASSTATGNSGSPLALHTGISTSTAPSSGSYVVVTGADGKIDSQFLNINSFGDGSDGDVTITATTTLTRDMYYDDLVINNTVYTNGYRIFAASSITGIGTVSATGTAGVSASAQTGGIGGSAVSGYTRNSAGGNGGNVTTIDTDCTNPGVGSSTSCGVAFNSATTNVGGFYSAGNGACGARTIVAGGAVTAYATSTKYGTTYSDTITIREISYATSSILWSGAGGGGGSTGYCTCASTCNGTTAEAGAGGGGGASGQIVLMASKMIGGTFTVNASGGSGGNGASGASEGDTTCGAGGGGGGGNGGAIIFVYEQKTHSGTRTANGGTAGTGGTTAAVNGTNGIILDIPISSLLR